MYRITCNDRNHAWQGELPGHYGGLLGNIDVMQNALLERINLNYYCRTVDVVLVLTAFWFRPARIIVKMSFSAYLASCNTCNSILEGDGY
jgi:hypothetical protein